MEELKQNNQIKAGKNTSTKGLDIIIIGAICLVFFLCPLFFTGLVAQGMGFEKLLLFYFLVLLGVVAWVTKGAILGELTLKRTPLDLPILATLVVFAVSTIMSISSKDSLIGSYGGSSKSLLALVIFILFYYLVINNLSKERVKTVFWSAFASGTVLTLFSFLQLIKIYMWPASFTHAQSFNPLGSLSELTMYLVIILPILLIAAAQTRELMPQARKAPVYILKILSGLIVALDLAILALLNGFTFWPVAIVSIVIVLMFFLSKIIKITNNNLLIPLFVFLALIILLVLGNFNIATLNLPAEVSLSRGASWEISRNSVMENPIFGSGPSTFYYNFSRFRDLSFNGSPLWNMRFDNASGIVFELLSSVGVLGTVAVGIVVLIALSITFLTLIKTEEKSVNSILLALFASLISIILFALLFAQNGSIILVNVIISVLAVSVAIIMYPEKFKTLKLSFRSSAKYALALAAIFLCVSAGVVVLFTMGLKMYMGDIYAKKAIDDQVVDSKILKLQRAISLAPYQDSYYLGLANNYMSKANQIALAGGGQAEVGANLSLAIENGKKAVEISGNKAMNNESLALIYENASFYTRGALEWAENLYKKVMELDPSNPVPYLRTALINMARANAETDKTEQGYYVGEAVKFYDRAIEKKGDLASAYYGKAIASEKLSNIDDAIEQLKRASLIAGNNIDYRFELGRLFFNRGVAQLNLNQTATKEITESEFTVEEEGGEGDELSVKPDQLTGNVVGRNEDLDIAEALFLNILSVSPNHANARYSLAVMYRKLGELDKCREQLSALMDILDQKTADVVREQFADILK
ncbi:hypothetical protein A2303_02775 [Candidatus Falkowbacteria bacterium RIFOXYB2_FULL_47_14]|uniref:Uncharacterized protein n=1 Tax=Candidatus Falkowbacteria bacterium RIFOXYA2_FULL_47_19 TaxID=1797994 RepID=A0A1F5SLP2_9BACT|nr:MAG: hypothetical protein A2227_01850 [Candidatus Falkowbacteria bacterium RIFOXYA2_FULL_47_19]OGF36242.1 MAG: hypothetical protein A2468_07520 [Candidatus Falkowbacteria bacterium RIFOXYC2_FULL_46_15]OGF43046.1 MAG: hypothetical protein A2303_02775 [Candidatus Falkowbacteria bacterium RIFOXYB2_FULL_47_14]